MNIQSSGCIFQLFSRLTPHLHEKIILNSSATSHDPDKETGGQWFLNPAMESLNGSSNVLCDGKRAELGISVCILKFMRRHIRDGLLKPKRFWHISCDVVTSNKVRGRIFHCPQLSCDSATFQHARSLLSIQEKEIALHCHFSSIPRITANLLFLCIHFYLPSCFLPASLHFLFPSLPV